MTSESGGDGRWLIEPPGLGQISFGITAGDEVQVTPEVQQAFEHLIRTLRGDDVLGYVIDRTCSDKRMTCNPNLSCNVETQAPCAIDYYCRIATFS